MPPLSSYTTTLPGDVLLETGVLYIGSSIFSAHEGGLQFDPAKTMRDVAFDGSHSAVKGLRRTSRFKPIISGTMIEFSPALLLELEPGATSVTLSGSPAGMTTGYRPKQAGTLYATGDYLSNVRLVFQRGDGTYVQVRFPAGIVNKWGLVGAVDAEAKIAIEIEACLDMSVSGAVTADAPYVIEYFTTAP